MALKQTIIIATMGHPLSLKPVLYRLLEGRGELTFCSRGSIIPTVVKRIEYGETIEGLLVVAPHSLQTSISELISDEEERQWGRGAASLVRSHLEGDIAMVSGQLSEMGRDDLSIELDKVRRKLFIEVVQGIGTFLDSKHIPPKVIRFQGKQSHLFYAVFKRLSDLLSSGSAKLVVDATHGWNFLSVLTLLSVSAFTKAWRGTDLEVEISEPVTRATAECGSGSPDISKSESTDRDLRLEDPVPLSLLEVADISRALSAVEAISRAMSLDYRPLEEMFLRGGDLWPEYIVEIMREVVRAICGLSSGVSVYSYHHLAKLDEMLSRYPLKADEPAEWLAYHVEEEENSGVAVRYVKEAPEVERVVLMSVQRLMSELGVGTEKGALRPSTGFKLGKMPLSYLRNLLKFYAEKGLLLQQKSLEAELYHLKDWDQELQNILSYSRAPGGGKGGKKVAEYIDFLNNNEYWSKVRELENLPLYSLFCACNSLFRESLSLETPNSIREKVKRDIENILLGQTSECSNWVHIMRAAWLLAMQGGECLRNGMVNEEDIIGMQRNLIAHSGIQHFSIRNIIREKTDKEEIIFLYDSDFLDGWDMALGSLCSPRSLSIS